MDGVCVFCLIQWKCTNVDNNRIKFLAYLSFLKIYVRKIFSQKFSFSFHCRRMVTKFWNNCFPGFSHTQQVYRHNFYLCQVSWKIIFFMNFDYLFKYFVHGVSYYNIPVNQNFNISFLIHFIKVNKI